MTIPLTFLTWGLAALPILTLMILMIGFHWGAIKAAPVGITISVLSALLVFRASPEGILVEALKGVWSTFVVLLVIWPAILLYEVVSQSNAFTVIRHGLQRHTPNELIQLLTLGWAFTSFLQGITGFGVPVAVGAPLLVGIGVNPVWAVMIPLIGHTWANTFGTLAVAWNAMVLQTNLSASPALLLETALWAAGLLWAWNMVTGVVITWLYGGRRALQKGWPAVLVISLIQGGGQLLLSQINPTLAAFVPAVLSMLGIIGISLTRRYRSAWVIEESPIMIRSVLDHSTPLPSHRMSLGQAFVPYLVLTGVTLSVLLIAPIKSYLEHFRFGFAFPQTQTGYGYTNLATTAYSPIAPLTNAGLFLLIAAVIGFVFFRSHGWIQSGGSKHLLARSFRKTFPSAIAILGFVVMSRIMSGTGQTVILAYGMASVLGQTYVVLAPVIGMLGAFMTSSNMASNILFSEFQLTTATLLKLNPAIILGSQTAGGAIGGTISPGNIIMGTTTAGVLGQEGKILRRVLPITLGMALLVGMVILIAQGM